MKAELEKLVALQKTDSLIKQLKKSIETIPERREVLEQEFETRAFEIRQLEKTRDDANAEKNKLEAVINDASTKLADAERKLKDSQNQKQYEAAVREKTVFEKQIADTETVLTEKTEAAEAAEKVLTERADDIAAIDTERQATFKKFDAANEQAKKQIIVEQKHRDEVFKTLPVKLAAVYNRLVMRIKDGVAVSEVKNGACSSCHMSVRQQRLVDIKMSKEIITCENCNRILYLIPVSETAVA